MTDILQRLAALIVTDEHGLVPCSCGAKPMLNYKHRGATGWCTDIKCPSCKLQGPPRKYEEDARTLWNTRPREATLIALLKEAAGEIEQLRQALGAVRLNLPFMQDNFVRANTASLIRFVIGEQEPTS